MGESIYHQNDSRAARRNSVVVPGRELTTNPGDMRPLVSVVVAFFNAEHFLQAAVESVIAQTYARWELLLIDDGSTDASTQIARRYAREHPDRIRYLEHEQHANRGVCASRNLGVRQARGELIATLDGDDVWLPHKLAEQVALLNTHPEAAMVCGRALYWRSWADEDVRGSRPSSVREGEDDQASAWASSTIAASEDDKPKLGIPGNHLYHPPVLFTRCHPLGDATAPCPSDVLVRRSVVEDIGGFEEEFVGEHQLYEDQAFFVKIYLRYPVFVADRTWIRYRIHPNSCMARVKDPDRVRRYFLSWLEGYLQRENIDPAVWRSALNAAYRPRPLTQLTSRLKRMWQRTGSSLPHQLHGPL